MNSDCERLQGFPDNWCLIGKLEEYEVKDYVTDWIPGKDCKYASMEELNEELYAQGELVDADDADDDDELVEDCGEDGFNPADYGFVKKRRAVGTHTESAYFYTDRFGRRKRCTDSARYKALGNSIAVGYANQQSGFWCWLARRIAAQYERQITLGSLFAGIGGFELAFSACGAKPVWNSEVEPFCIEVLRRRFGDEEVEVVD